ncbi:MAG: SIS domain-containing protein [Alphaproteobacteria bacterium]
MNSNTYLSSQFDSHAAIIDATRDAVAAPFAHLLTASVTAIRGGGKIVFFGNGGSAADAQHLATELGVRYITDRDPIAAIALTTDTSSLTAIGNDFGFDELFARQVAALVRDGDVVIGLSTSGNSENVVRGLTMARRMGAVTSALTGDGGGRLGPLVDALLAVPSTDTARIQEMHILIGHAFCGALEQELDLI